MNTRYRSAEAIYQDLVRRMDRFELPSYVYTYPPKGAYRPFDSHKEVQDAWADVTGPATLYVHVPYCDMKCHFCTLFQTTSHSPSTRSQYVSTLKKEFDIVTELINIDEIEIQSIYFGGGTPTVLKTNELSSLLEYFAGRFRINKSAEIGIESTPDAVDMSRLRDLIGCGFNRISFGIQTFDEDELKSVGRRYGAQLGYEMALGALQAGFPNVNIDLIYGLPKQPRERWINNLNTAIGMEPTTITIYPVVVRERAAYGKKYRQNPESFSDDETKYELYDLAEQQLTESGYKQHTFVTFAREGGGNHHEANEFEGTPTIALGAGARSYTPSLHYTSDEYFEPKSTTFIIKEYQEAVISNRLPVRAAISLSREDQIRRFIILNLLHTGVSRDSCSRKFGTKIEALFSGEIEALRMADCVEDDGDRLELTRKGKRFSSLIAYLLTGENIHQEAKVYA